MSNLAPRLGPERLRFGRADSHKDAAWANRLVWGDNLRALAATADASVDLVYIDPPFGTGVARRGRGQAAYLDRDDDPDAFVHWLWPRLEHCRRALSATGSLFVHLDYRSVHYVKVALDRLFGRARFVNEIVWGYSVGGKSRRSFARKHDTILWYARSARYAFYPDAVRVPRKPNSHMRVVRDDAGHLVQEKTDRRTGKVYRYPVAEGKVPEDYWTDIETLNRADAERTGWPTQKPERLLARILQATTRPGDVVADYFAGSGTTPAVAQRLGRRFIAADEQADAIAICRDRLAAQARTLASPPPDLVIEPA